MTPDQMRVKVAEACGWKYHPTHRGGVSTASWEHPKGGYRINPPDYPADLNACAEMERTLTAEQRIDYFYALNEVLNLVSPGEPSWIKETCAFAHCHATAPQRCEAFLRVRGLWEEGT